MTKKRLIGGLRAVEQLLSTRRADVRRIYAEYQSANPRVVGIIQTANEAGIAIQSANRARLTQMSGETRHQGVVAELSRNSVIDEAGLRTLVENKLQAADGLPLLLLILDGIQDPHNLGACLRTADAAGVDAVVIPRHGAAGMGPTVSKVAAGAAEVIPLATVGNLKRVFGWLSEYGVRIIGTSDKAEHSVFEVDIAGAVALAMGREHTGLGKALVSKCDDLVSLPMKGVVSSLNVSVATGVCLYEITRQRALHSR